MRRKGDILDVQHWKFADYQQRMEAKDWKELLLNGDDKIAFNGHVIQLVSKNLGCGIYEISKQITNDG